MNVEAKRAERRRFVTGAVSLVAAPIFLGGLYLAGRAGIELADRQVPPGSLDAPEAVETGSRWRIEKAGLALSADQASLREFDFRRAGSRGAEVGGVLVLGAESLGWELQILPGGDRRYLRSKFLSGDRQGDEQWLISKQVRELASPTDEG